MNVREVRIGARTIGDNHPTYFVADIGANHDGDLLRAIDLIHRAAAAGANAAKFQHFTAETIVSDRAFRALPQQLSHQAAWKKGVFEVYADASIDLGWTPELKAACDAAGIAFLTAPYSIELVDAVDPYVAAFKIGSGDITWLEIIRHIARRGRPVLLATGASTLDEVNAAADIDPGRDVGLRPDAVQHELHWVDGQPQARQSERASNIPTLVPRCGVGTVGPHPGIRRRSGSCSAWCVRR